MRIFVAGATGAVGRALVPALVSAGHSVTGMTRSPEKADAIRRAGAEPVVADGLNARAVRAAVISARPDVIIDEMTDLATVTDLAPFRPRVRQHQPPAHRRDGSSAGGRARGRSEALHRAELLRLDPQPRGRTR